MSLPHRPRVPLARLPTPLEPLPHVGASYGLDLWIKRDDLTGSALSGNKVRKLEFLLARAQELGVDAVITCGAVTSNHARATAVAGARLGMRSHLLLRGDDTRLEGNLLLDRYLGAATTFVDHDGWIERDARMEAIANALRAQGHTPFVIPEGGSNALGALGYAAAAGEILGQVERDGRRLRRVVHATGSGGTTAGLAIGFAAFGRPDVDVIGVAVCDGSPYFDAVVARIHDEGVRDGHWSAEIASTARWTIWDGHKGVGYAKTTDEEMAFHAGVARETGLILDPVYAGKAFRGMVREAQAGRLEGPGSTVFVHTGGIFGLFSFAQEVRRLPDPDTGPQAG